TPSQRSVHSKSKLTKFSLQRTVSTVSTPLIQQKTRPPRSSVTSVTLKRSCKDSRSLTRPRSACAWTTACRCESSGWNLQEMSRRRSEAKTSVRSYTAKLEELRAADAAAQNRGGEAA